MSPPAVSSPPQAPSTAEGPDRLATLRRHRRWLLPLVALALLAQMAAAMLTTAVQQTPTIDEPVYVGAAASYMEQHSLRYNPEHPPLGKLVIGAGLALTDVHLAPGFTGTQEELGRRVLYEWGNDAGRVMLMARLPMIVLTLLFGLVVLAFATDLTGRAGGLAALALYTLSPDVIAHGSLATLDVLSAGLLLTSAWLLWRARRRPLLYLPLAGAALGAALATKMSMLAAVPVLLLLALLSAWSAVRAPGDPAGESGADASGPRPGKARIAVLSVAAAAGVALVAVVVVWASYLAVDPRLRWVTPQTVPAVDGLRGLAVGWLPFPEPFRDGMRVQFGMEDRVWGGFLFGRHYQGSLWYYQPVALLVKTPLGMLALWAAGAAAMVSVRRLRAAAPYVLLAPGVLLAVAMNGSRDFGTRYAVFVPLFLAVAAAGVLALRRRWRWTPVAAAALLAFVAASSLRTFPYYLPYSNEAFGGPSKTHLRLHDSNVDWGQDLGRLADRLRERHPGEKVWLVYKGSGVPSYYGIRASDPLKVPPGQVKGLLVVSDTSIAKAGGRLARLIDGSERIGTVGHSITIFRRG
ncbi:phospholipid carrier-dependent glycosyltransferase [Actinomadura vinacea]|uniref:Phospholipid carrier-dependent glycosyltransferase n=2 Tax=Actinomadura vinacea TaxID=115336 RepID=A0ABN3KCV3_9ACTN